VSGLDRSTDLASAAYLAGRDAIGDLPRRFRSAPFDLDRRSDLIDAEIDTMAGCDNHLSEIIGYILAESHDGSPLLAQYRNRDWIAFGEGLCKAVDLEIIDRATKKVDCDE
jgi:hypothetical protein